MSADASRLGVRSGFGPDDDDPEDLASMFVDEDVETDDEQPDEQAAPEVPPWVEDEPPVEEEEEPEGEEVPAEEESAEDTERMWAGKYAEPEQLETAYTEITRAFTQATQENRQMRDREAAFQAQINELQQQLSTVVEVIQSDLAERDPDFAEQLAERQRLAEAVAQQVGPLQEQLAQQQVAARQAELDRAIAASATTFYNAHPEIAPGSREDAVLTETTRQLLTAGVPLDITNPDHLEVALAAAAEPQVVQTLIVNKDRITPQQISFAASQIKAARGATIPQNPQGSPATGTRPKGPARRRLDAHLETGSGGAPMDGAPGESPKDEFDEAWDYWQQAKDKGPLFGGSRK